MNTVSLATPLTSPLLRQRNAPGEFAAAQFAAEIPPSPTPTTAPNAPAAAAAPSGFAGGDFETFLKMLTTQIKNQDPLNPMEGSDFAVQLATFSGVEQQVRTNQLLEKLAGANDAGLVSMAEWIGRDVRTTAPVHFDGRPLTLDIQPDPAASQVELVTLDGSGREVLRESIGTGAGEIDWVGRSGSGEFLGAGTYSFKLVSKRGDDILKTAAVGVYVRVLGVETTADGTRLTLPGGATALETQVTALREAR